MSESIGSTDAKNGRGINVNQGHYNRPESNVMTGRQLKSMAGIPETHSLYRRGESSHEPITDDEPVELRDGDDFFSRPPSNVS